MKQRKALHIMVRLIVLVKPMIPIMCCAIILGVAGFLCAIFVAVLGSYGLLGAMGLETVSLTGLFVFLFVIALLRGVLHYGEQACNHFIAFKLLAVIRADVFAVLRQLAPAKLEGKDRGNLISLITSDVEQLEVFYAHTISPIVIAILVSLIMLVFLAHIHFYLMLVALVGYIFVGIIVPLRSFHKGYGSGVIYREKFGELNTYLLDNLRGLDEIIQYNKGAVRKENMEHKTKELQKTQKSMRETEGTTKGIVNVIIVVCSMVMLLIGVFLFQRQAISFSGLVMATTTMLGSFGPVIAISNLSHTLPLTLSSGNRILNLLEEKPVVIENTCGKLIKFTGATCDKVSFGYEAQEVLHNISIDFPQGEIIGILGRSGSGKSTLLKLLMRFWDVSDGKISLSNVPIQTIHIESLREAESYVTQETYLFHDTIAANIKLGKWDATEEEIITASKKASLHDFVMTLPQQYQTNVGELGDGLSGGEQQRIGLARAFLHDAPFLLLDEPTSNLDSLNEGIILQSIQEHSRGKTVVLVSHRKSTINIADTTYSVEHGRIS